MAIMLPQEGNIWQALGTGLGSGLQALAQGKIQQLQNRNFANSLQSMGLDPNIINLPQPLQQIAIQQHYKGLDALQKQQSVTQEYGALLNQAKQLGLSPDFIKTVEDAGPSVGAQMLKGIIRDLQKPDKSQNWLQSIGLLSPTGRSVYKTSASPVLNALNQKYASNVAPNTAIPTENVASEYEAYLQNPDISAEEKQALREEKALFESQGSSGYGLLETPAGIFGNILSGGAQGIGALAGLPRLLENVLSPMVEKIGRPIVEAEINEWNKRASEAAPGSKEKELALKHVDLLKKDLQTTGLKKPVTQSFEDIKENVVIPFAKMFGAEKYVVPRNFVEQVSERVGRVAPATLLSAIGRGTQLGLDLLKTLNLPIAAESVGQLTKKFTGSDVADGAMTLLGYLGGAYSPNSWNDAIKKGYESFKNKIGDVPRVRVDATPILEDIQPIIDRINTLPGTQGNKFLKNQIEAVDKAINYVSPSAAGKANIPSTSITPHKAFELDQLLGGDTYGSAEKIGKETAQGIQSIREGLRKIWEPYFAQSIPNATKDVLAARDAASLLHFTDKTQDTLTAFANAKTPLFYLPGHALKFAARLIKPTRKFIIQMSRSPLLWEITSEAISEAAKGNASGIAAALNKLPKDYK